MKNSFVKNSMTLFVMVVALNSLSVSAEVAQAGAYKIDPAHTSVQFSVSHLGISNLIGRFNDVAGTINFAPKGKSSVEVTIQTGSIDSNHEKRDIHLRGPDFFNAKQFPVIKFESTKVSYNAKGEPIEITGKLSMHGKTADVTLAVKPVGAGKDPWGGYRAGYEASTTIKRAEFGMNYMPNGIGADVTITLNIEAIKQ